MSASDDSTVLSSSRRLALHVLASGSRGNASIVEDRKTHASLIIDCGICKRDFFARADRLGQSLKQPCGLLITHDHSDHTKGLGVVLRGLVKSTGKLPLYTSKRVRASSAPIAEVIDQDLVEFHPFEAGSQLTIGPFRVHVFRTSHDAAESFGFRISTTSATFDDGSEAQQEHIQPDALGYVTDTGYLSEEALAALRSVRLLALESNHDRQMLANGPYPALLKERVGSDRGHLSNDQAAMALAELVHDGLEQVVAMHVSQNNNTYTKAVNALAAVVTEHPNLYVQAAYQDRPITVG